MIKFFTKNKMQCGYAILELLFYIAFFAILSLVVINAMITMSKAFKETTIQAEFMQSGTIMERMSREIRGASDITLINGSDLVLKTADSRNPEFKLSSADLQLWENGIVTGNLNTPNIIITTLTFTQITTAKSKAVKIFLTLKSFDDPVGRTQNFYDTIVLRGSY